MPISISDNAFPKVILAEQGGDPATPSTGQWKVYAKADGLYLIDDAGAVTGPFGGGGLETGSSFPVSPTTGDRYRRSDLDYEVYFYDGTRWLSENTYRSHVPINPAAAQWWSSGSNGTSPINTFRSTMPSDRDIYVLQVDLMGRVATTNNGSNYWTFEFGGNDGTGLVDVTGGLSSVAQSAATFFNLTASPNAVIDTGDVMLTSRETKVGSPGNLDHLAYWYSYKLVAT